MSYSVAYERESADPWGFVPKTESKRAGHERSLYSAPDILVSDERGKPQPLPIAAACRQNMIDWKLHLGSLAKVLSAVNTTVVVRTGFNLGQPRNFAYNLPSRLNPWLLFANHQQIADSLLADAVSNHKVLLSAHLPRIVVRAALPEWVVAFYKEPVDKASRSSFRVLFTEVGSLLRDGDTRVLDGILASVEMGRLPPELVMGLVRATYVARARLPSWRAARTRAVAELRKRGLPADEVMVGLLSDTDDNANKSRR